MIPFIVSAIPAIPKVPFFQKKELPKKELKCLNLKEIVNSKQSASIFESNLHIRLDEEEIDKYFKLHKETKINSENLLKKDNSLTLLDIEKTVELSSLIENNKYTVICKNKLIYLPQNKDISIKKLNSVSNFNLFIENFHYLIFSECPNEEQEENFKLMNKMLFNQDILNSLSLILLNENEINHVLTNLARINQDKLMGDTERWLIKFCNYPQIKTIINTLQNFFAYKVSLEEIHKTVDLLVYVYDNITANKKIKKFFNIILKINNYLNSQTGNKEIKGFDIRIIDSLLFLKLNSINFFNYVMQVYIDNSSIEKENSCDLDRLLFFSRRDENILDNIIDPSNSTVGLFECMKKIKENLNSDFLKISDILPSNLLKIEINNFHSDLLSLAKCNEDIFEKEDERRRIFMEFFNFPENNSNSQNFVVSIIKTLININNKMRVYLNQNNFQKIEYKENSDSKQAKKEINNTRKASKSNLDLQMNFINQKYKLK